MRLLRQQKILVKCISVSQLIPPSNEVWGKVMFLHLSVSHFVHRGGVVKGVKGGVVKGGVVKEGVV